MIVFFLFFLRLHFHSTPLDLIHCCMLLLLTYFFAYNNGLYHWKLVIDLFSLSRPPSSSTSPPSSHRCETACQILTLATYSCECTRWSRWPKCLFYRESVILVTQGTLTLMMNYRITLLTLWMTTLILIMTSKIFKLYTFSLFLPPPLSLNTLACLILLTSPLFSCLLRMATLSSSLSTDFYETKKYSSSHLYRTKCACVISIEFTLIAPYSWWFGDCLSLTRVAVRACLSLLVLFAVLWNLISWHVWWSVVLSLSFSLSAGGSFHP